MKNIRVKTCKVFLDGKHKNWKRVVIADYIRGKNPQQALLIKLFQVWILQEVERIIPVDEIIFQHRRHYQSSNSKNEYQRKPERYFFDNRFLRRLLGGRSLTCFFYLLVFLWLHDYTNSFIDKVICPKLHPVSSQDAD